MNFPVFLLCVLAGDFITGFVHWWEDTYGLPTWPVIGKAVIVPNIEHHLNPRLLIMGTVWSRNYQPVGMACIVIWVAWLVGFLTLPLVAIALIAAFGNEFHACNHRAAVENPGWVNFLHDVGFIQSRQQHGKHHHEPFAEYFCTITNVVNPVLKLLHFWRLLEGLVSKTRGVRPNRMTEVRNFV